MRRFVLTLALAAAAIAACDDSTGPGADSLFGTYTLISINGAAVPVTVNFEPDGLQATVISGSLVLEEDGDASLSLRVRVFGEEETQLSEGTFTRNGDNVVVTWTDDGASNTFVHDEGRRELTLNSAGNLVVFRKA